MDSRPDVLMSTGRSDYPNQINNVIGFPYIFRGALDVNATAINEEMKMAAVYAIADLVARFNPDYVVVLSGDHIYKMDYAAMMHYHEEHNASCTIAVRNVPLEEASRFGILNTNPDNSIYEFEEKPAKPKSTNPQSPIPKYQHINHII